LVSAQEKGHVTYPHGGLGGAMIRATLFDRGQVADLLVAYAHASTYCSEDQNTSYAALTADVFEAKTREDKKKRKRDFVLSLFWTILRAFSASS